MRKKYMRIKPGSQKLLTAGILLLVLLLFMVSCGDSSNDSSSGGGTVDGVVYDNDSMEGLDNVEVSIGDYTTQSDKDGNFILSNIPGGTYTIRVSRNDYETLSESVTIEQGLIISYEIYMETTFDDWLQSNTTYNWQVEAVQEDGTVLSGPVWSFTTENEEEPISISITKKVNNDTAEKIALHHIKAYGGEDYSIASMKPLTDKKGQILGYLFILNPSGYLIIPACMEDVLPPVLAYSYTTTLTLDSPFARRLMQMAGQDIGQRLTALQKNAVPQAKMMARNNSLWKKYLSGEINPGVKGKTVYGPFLFTPTWGQSSPYNNSCPMDPQTDERCIVGCVATAYSQVFNYWWRPVSFTFSSDFDYSTYTRGIQIKAENANMYNIDYNKGYPDDATKAGLSYACGVMARMNYTSDNSGANTLAVAKAIKSFGYYEPKTIRFEKNETFIANEIINDIKATPMAQPVILSISQVDSSGNWNGGHAIVCDGYNTEDNTFHLNLGWYGSKDGWYSLPEGMPAKYSVVKGYVYDILPQDTNYKTASQLKAASKSEYPENPYPIDGDTDITIDEALDWNTCDNAAYYNCYIWKSDEEKPAEPTFEHLPYAAAYPTYSEKGK